MGKIISERKSAALADQNFRIILQTGTLEFTGSWIISEANEQPGEATKGSSEDLVQLDNENYRIYHEDLPAFTEIINDLKPGANIHLRIRVVSPQNEVRKLEASGCLTRAASKDILSQTKPDDTTAIMSTRTNGHLDAVLNAGLIGTFHWDSNKDVFIADESTQRYFSINEKALTVGVTLSDLLVFVYDPDKPLVANAFAHAIEQTGNLSVECHVKSQTGDLRRLLVRGVIEKNRSGSAIGIAGVTIDITTTRETNQALQESERRQAFLLTLNDSIRSAVDVDEIQHAACRLLAEHLLAARTYFIEYDDNNATCVINHDYVRSNEISRVGTFPISDLEHLTQGVSTGQTWVIHDTFVSSEIDANVGSHLASTGVRAIMAAPVMRHGKMVAALVVTHSTARQWAPADIALVKETAERTWAALEKEQTERTLRESVTTNSEELEKSYEVLRQSEELASIGSWDYHFRTKEFKWSDGMYELFNIQTGSRVRPEIYSEYAIAEDKQKASHIVDHFHKDLGPLEETLRINVNNKVKTLKVKGNVFHEKGKPSRFIGVDFDISALVESRSALEEQHERLLEAQGMLARQAEDKYRQLFNSIDEGFSIIELFFDGDGKPNDFRFIEANPAFERQTGFKNILGLTIRRVAPEYDQRWMDMYGKVATTMNPVRFIEQLASRWYEVYAFPAGEAGSNRIGILTHDITERKQSEQEMKKLYGELKELDKAKTNFFNNITHEFRTPLTLLLGPLDDIIRKSAGDLPARQRDQLLLAQRHALRLQKLVNTLLDFSRIEAGQMDAVFQPTDIGSLTRDLAGNFRSAIENAGLKFTVKCDKVDGAVYLNSGMYEKIVLNLLSNAFKFTFDGGIEVKVRQSKNNVELHVTDTGIGISPADQHRIFRQFNRVEGTKSRTYEGTGIGLALVKEMVKMHGGDISVKSEPGSGSEFIVSIPKGKDHLPSDRIVETTTRTNNDSLPGYLEEVRSWLNTPVANEKNSPGENDTITYIKPVVLIVDDNNDMRSYLSSILDSRYKVIHAENGRKAIKIIEAGLIPDIVVTDVMMPEMNGYELLAAIKHGDWPKDIPVILLTAQANEEARIEGLHYGADDYLVKPFSSHELLARVQSRIQIAHLKSESEKALLLVNRELETLVEKRTLELKTKNDMLHHRNLQLNSINEELTGLTFAAGHDMREPLRKLRFFAHRLVTEEAGNLSPKGTEYFHKIMSFIQSMNDLVSDIALYSYYNDNPAPAATVNLDVLLTGLHEFLKPVLDEKNATLSINVVPVLSGDYEQIKQLVSNLISNALKFRKPGLQLNIVISGKVIAGKFIEHEMAETHKSYYELEVRDNGIGFEQQYEKQIFQIFRKLHGRATSPGTGVGLSIVRKIVENHRGFVTAKSTLGLGSSFKCYFPIQGPIL